MKLLLTLFWIIILNVVHTKLPAQEICDSLLTVKREIDSIVGVINTFHNHKPLSTMLQGIYMDREYTAHVFSTSISSLTFRKITIKYEDTTLNKCFFYKQDVLIRADSGQEKYYNISGRIIDQGGVFADSPFSRNLINEGADMIKLVRLLL